MPATSAGHSAVQITELLPDPGDGQEFIEIYNAGDASIDLGGWRLQDAAGNTYGMTGVLDAGMFLVVWGGQAGGPGLVWNKAAVWNNGGDLAMLLDEQGTVVDSLAYGSASAQAPHEAWAPAPATGDSLQADGTAWQSGEPTPGQALGAQGGEATITISNAVPVPAFGAGPAWAPPASETTITVDADDDNGPGDIVAWRLWAGPQLVADGESVPEQVSVMTPASPQTWTLRLEVEDQAGAIGNATLGLAIRHGPLAFDAGEPWAMPAIAPGEAPEGPVATFTVRNDDDKVQTPFFDASPLRGPATVPVEGLLRIAVGTPPTWVDYQGPLTPLPALPPGQQVTVALHLQALPTPMPAGAYGLTYTVVA